ncbi:MAG: hypothetical protein U9R56_02635 [candidate division Zixibacteria bacterium]|nr:hypothetical protein [candidate division Zixibacteria bacterium]
MKKVILAVCLLIVVVGVTYIKMVRGSAERRSSYQKGRKAASEELLTYQQKVDSLRYLIGQHKVMFADSLVRKDLFYQKKIDSLILSLDSVWSTSDMISVDEQLQKQDDSQAESDSAEMSPQHEEILAFYAKLYKDLPNDLSKYEWKVALHEIRLKTVHEFPITLADLKALRSQSGINY